MMFDEPDILSISDCKQSVRFPNRLSFRRPAELLSL